MQAILGEQDVRQQAGARAAPRDRMPWRRWLVNGFTRAARELLTDVLDDLPRARDQLQRLGHILAELAQHAAATRARRRRRINDAFARQMFGQRPARWLLALERRNRDLGGRRRSSRQSRLGFRLRSVLLNLRKPQLKLVEHGAAFRGLTKPFMLELGDRVLHLLDHKLPDAQLGLSIAGLDLR